VKVCKVGEKMGFESDVVAEELVSIVDAPVPINKCCLWHVSEEKQFLKEANAERFFI
jgi:hypothetical protein